MHKDMCDAFPSEIDNGTIGGQGIAILPIGSVEQHGPHLLLGCDAYIAQGIAQCTAERSGGFLLPMIAYSWVGGLRVWSGTLDIRSQNMGRYIEKVCVDIIKAGFKRLLIVNCHGGGREMTYLAASRVSKITGIPVLAMYPGKTGTTAEMKEIWNKYGVRLHGKFCEGSIMLGGLKKMGRKDLIEKVEKANGKMAKVFEHTSRSFTAEPLKKVFEISEIGHDYLVETQHVFPESTANANAGEEVIDSMADRLYKALSRMNEKHIMTKNST